MPHIACASGGLEVPGPGTLQSASLRHAQAPSRKAGTPAGARFLLRGTLGPMTTKAHWEGVYDSKAADAVSWYRPTLERSLELIAETGIRKDAHIADVGGGASTLVDDLLSRGHTALSVADISANALQVSQARLGAAAGTVRWVVGDATTELFAPGSVALWHDRAVFHFLAPGPARDAYLEQLRRSLAPSGFALIATFASDGPERCSGLPVHRYTPEQIAAALGPDFVLRAGGRDEHHTPGGSVQAFSYALCKRSGPA